MTKANEFCSFKMAKPDARLTVYGNKVTIVFSFTSAPTVTDLHCSEVFKYL
jgi:hypothetical protein